MTEDPELGVVTVTWSRSQLSTGEGGQRRAAAETRGTNNQDDIVATAMRPDAIVTAAEARGHVPGGRG